MKKIRIKMATVAPVQAENIPGDGTNKGKKKKWYKKVIGKLVPPIWPAQSHDEPAKEEREITIEDVQKLIEEQQYEYASKGLIELEHKIDAGSEEPTLHMKDLEPLYEKLKAEVFRVIKKSITSTDKELLQEAIQAIVVQESEDSKCISDLKNADGSRPKGWLQTWKECVRQTVEERIQDLPQEEKLNGPPTIIFPIISIGKLFKNDLIHLVTHLKACYPENFDVCNTYAQHYHRKIKTRTEEITQFELCEKDNFAVLCWVHNLYPNEILKNSHLAEHIDDSRLECLLSQEVVRLLENNFLHNERDSFDEHMNKALHFEAELWKNEMEPKMLGSYYHSELQIDIIQCHDGSLKKAAEIGPELVDKLTISLQNNLYEILQRYKKVFEEYIFSMEKSKTQNFYKETCITHLNCCLGLRTSLFRKEAKLRQGLRIKSTLLQLEDNIYNALLQDLFMDIKNNFKKMSQGSSPFSYQTMQNIIRIAETFMEPFHTLMDESYKVLSGKIHLFLVKEHLARILKRKVSYKSVQQMQTLATQISENAELIDSFSAFYRSGEDWLKPALPKVAEIIRLQDLNAIQLEVATLVEAYPDIRNKQIEAILYMKGNLSRNEVKSILKTADMVERRVNDKQKLFESIKPS